jgi:hypothetical protein
MLAVLLFAAAVAAAATPPKVFSDGPGTYTLPIPDTCSVRPKSGPNTPSFIDCAHGYAFVEVGPGSDKPSLQKIVNSLIGNWNNLKLLQNQMAGKLGGLPSRLIYAEGTLNNEPASIEMIAATKGGQWYVLTMAAPQNEWAADGLAYFASIKAGFKFTAPARKPQKK